MRILFVASEVSPWIKTGGLADVSSALPKALARLGHDVRVLMPAYQSLLNQHPEFTAVANFHAPTSFGDTHLLTSPSKKRKHLPTFWFIDAPIYRDRAGNPYHDDQGNDWPDNAQRFDHLAKVATLLARDAANLNWQPEIVHCNDWQTGLVPVRMMLERAPVASVFTIHNLHYQGTFPYDTLRQLGLPDWLWHPQALEFYGQLSFIKGGLCFAERISTVSPTYAQEILQPEQGCHLDALLRHRQNRLHGILNGIDTDIWNPETDPELSNHYKSNDLSGKVACKSAIQQELGLTVNPEIPLVGVISRLVDQKGLDLLLAALPELMTLPLQWAILGSGESWLEQALIEATGRWSGQIAVHLGYNESLAHRIEAGADMFLMPSRFEPCGLNQMYSLRYGTLPIVRRCGGLADTVIDASAENLANGIATGFVFESASREALIDTLRRAVSLYRQPNRWRMMIQRAMQEDFSWARSAQAYLNLYRQAQEDFR